MVLRKSGRVDSRRFRKSSFINLSGLFFLFIYFYDQICIMQIRKGYLHDANSLFLFIIRINFDILLNC